MKQKNINEKLIVFTYIAFTMILLALQPAQGSVQAEVEHNTIPEEAIRLRILANSNAEDDQHLKRAIRDRVNYEISNWVGELESTEKAREVIKSHLNEIETIVQATLVDFNKQQSFTVSFENVQFPTKMYGEYIYPAGIYEALLVTLGDGQGANWWCVLFPPLCFLDFSNGDAVDEADPVSEVTGGDVEVKFFVVELFDGLVGFIKSII
jgi:stage II sporulation protein R